MNLLQVVGLFMIATAVFLAGWWLCKVTPSAAERYLKKQCSADARSASDAAFLEARSSSSRAMQPPRAGGAWSRQLEWNQKMNNRVARLEAVLLGEVVVPTPSQAPDLTLGPKGSEGTPTPLKDASPATALTPAPTIPTTPTRG